MRSRHLNASDALLDLWQLGAPLDAFFLTSMHLLLCLISGRLSARWMLNASDTMLDLWQLSAPLDALILTSMHLLLCLISGRLSAPWDALSSSQCI